MVRPGSAYVPRRRGRSPDQTARAGERHSHSQTNVAAQCETVRARPGAPDCDRPLEATSAWEQSGRDEHSRDHWGGIAGATARTSASDPTSIPARQQHHRAAGSCASAATVQGSDSDGQTSAALGAAGPDHGTTAASAHPHEKTVGTFAASDRGLVGAFHCEIRVNFREPQIRY